jgi:lantibiotic modifying enzyme
MAEEIASEATHDPGSGVPGWTGPEVAGDEAHWSVVVRPVGPGLYAGSAGISLALATASRLGGGSHVAGVAGAAAHASLAQGHQRLAAGEMDLASGASGIAYACAWVGRLLDDEGLLRGARALARATSEQMVGVDAQPDLLTGSSGAIVALLATCPEDPDVVGRVSQLAAGVAAGAQVEPFGVSWPTDPIGGPGLLGLAHGASGMAWALLEAARVGGSHQLEPVARAAWDYERSWFDPQAPGWPDLRAAGSDPMVAWCHGALGIGIMRLAWVQGLGAGAPGLRFALLAEASAAVEAARARVMAARAALREGQGTDCSLCHGLTGVVELLVAASNLPGGSDHLRAASKVVDLMLAERETIGAWPCGLPVPEGAGTDTAVSPEPPGLFLGRSGILLGLLRAEAADDLPAMALPGIALPTQVPAEPDRQSKAW